MTEYDCKSCGETLTIVDIVTHECNEILHAETLSRSERNTLMYVESCVVDQDWELDPEKMNFEDFQNMKVFRAAGILDVDEHGGKAVQTRNGRANMHLVEEFTDQAWDIVRDSRKMRAEA